MTLRKFELLLAVVLLVLTVKGGDCDTINFDNLDPGTTVAYIQGVTFTSNIVYDLVVSSGFFETTSQPNYLGVADGGFELFFPEDVVRLDFDVPVTSLVVDFISSPGNPGETFVIDTGSVSATSGNAPDIILDDGGEVYQVSLMSAGSFLSAELVSNEGFYTYNIDDISFVSVPIANTFLYLCSGLGVLLILRRKSLMQM